MWYVYVLQSEKEDVHSKAETSRGWYIGCTDDLQQRFSNHNDGKSTYTKHRRPWKLIYYEAGLNKHDAFKREKYLKSGWGRKWLERRLNEYFKNVQ